MNAFEIKIPHEQLRTAQIIAFALPTGCAIFIGILTIVLHPPQPPFNFEIDTLLMVLLAKSAFLLPASFVIPNVVFKQMAQQNFSGVNLLEEVELESNKDVPPTQISKFMRLYQTRMIIGSAMMEGIVFFAAILYLINQTVIGLAIASLLTIVLYTRIPTMTKAQNCLANLASEHDYELSKKV